MRDTTQQSVDEQAVSSSKAPPKVQAHAENNTLIEFTLIRKLLIVAIAGLSLACPTQTLAARKHIAHKAQAAKSFAYRERKDAMAFADTIAEQQGLDREWVRQTIGDARFIPVVQKLMQPAGHGFVKNWNAYRSRFIEPLRIENGVEFWRTNADALARAEKDFGVPPEVIVGIIGVETIYGRHMGAYRVIDALATLAFDFPRTADRDRSAFFQSELSQFLAMQSHAGFDIASVKGSYAGAIGLGQFMPSSWVRFAVDYDGDGQIDLRGSPADAIGSIANFLKSANWRPGMPAYYPISLVPSRTDMTALLAPDIRPTLSPADLTASGIMLDERASKHAGPLALVELLNGDPELDGSEPIYVAGTENFYAISRYNRSSYYAMAVIELGETIRTEVMK